MIRRANAADALAMGKVYCRGWQEGYRSLLPAEFLDGLTPENCAPNPAKIGGSGCLVAEQAGEVVGLTSFGAARNAAPEGMGELMTIYVLPEYWRLGVGSELFRAAAQALREAGHRGFYLWTLKGNVRARAFYERLGMWESGRERTLSIAGMDADEVQYEMHFAGASNE